MNKRIFMTPVRFTFQKPIIERDAFKRNVCGVTDYAYSCVSWL